ncbi:hypothetical protein MBLNU13_g05629t1 [Cladosporium sp. NU13]
MDPNARPSTRAYRAARRAQRSFLDDVENDNAQPAQSAGTNGVAGPDEEINDDDLCPICQMLLHEPVTTTCRHTLCRFCMATWASTSQEAPMTIVDVDSEPVPFDAVSGLEARCPMCRTLTSALPDAQRDATLRSRYPQTWTQRYRETAAEQNTESSGSIQTITVHIGNRHTLIPPREGELAENQHEWVFFVKPSRTDIIKEVHIHLHPTFRQNHVIKTRAPYSISRIGWGHFTITARVVLKAGYTWVSEDAEDLPDGAAKGSLPLEWTLDFDGFGGKGSMGRCQLKVRTTENGTRTRSRKGIS